MYPAKQSLALTPAALHGQATTFIDQGAKAIIFAAIFLPGKVKNATNGQKEVIVVHELIHAAVLDEWHDSGDNVLLDAVAGADCSNTFLSGGVKPMPPIRLGAATRNEMGRGGP